jgi:hypothetical protein
MLPLLIKPIQTDPSIFNVTTTRSIWNRLKPQKFCQTSSLSTALGSNGMARIRAKFARTSDRIIGAERIGANMNLQKAAEAEKERRTRSKLEPHREAIFTLRRKHWTYVEIAKWLNDRGISITLSSVHRFCGRAIARRPRNGITPQLAEIEPLCVSQPAKQSKTEPKKYRFNLEI